MGYALTFVAGLVLGFILMRHWFFVYLDMYPKLRKAYDETDSSERVD